MILVDSTVWIDHLVKQLDALHDLLLQEQVVCHPFVLGEIALGHVRQREKVLIELKELPQTEIAYDEEVMELIRRQRLFGKGIGYVDAHLLTCTFITPDCRLWTRDRRLADTARHMGIAARYQ